MVLTKELPRCRFLPHLVYHIIFPDGRYYIGCTSRYDAAHTPEDLNYPFDTWFISQDKEHPEKLTGKTKVIPLGIFSDYYEATDYKNEVFETMDESLCLAPSLIMNRESTPSRMKALKKALKLREDWCRSHPRYRHYYEEV